MAKKNNTRSRFRPVEIGNIDGKRTVLEAVPEAMTSFGGAPMLRMIEEQVGLVDEFCKRVNDRRNEKYIDHPATDIVFLFCMTG